jgi:phospholipase C
LNCYPLKWQTTPETYEAAGVSWQVYQDTDNFDDNALAYFDNFQKAAKGSSLQKKGLAYLGLNQFYKDAAAGTLPAVSFIVGPAELSEHPPYMPSDGGWLQQRIVNAVTQSPKYNKTVLMISYDETGGWGDHVLPVTSPRGTSGEWVKDPYGTTDVSTGPGFRLPFYIISPWTRGGNVFVEPSDHNSQIMFVEKWLAAKGKTIKTTAMNAWRRAHMADLMRAFDFSNPDFSIPNMPNISYPSTDKPGGNWNGYSVCENTYATRRPPVPYGQQSPNDAPAQTEEGFKKMRGNPTEGRYLTFESNGFGLTNAGNGSLTTTAATASHSSKVQRFVLYASNPDASVLQQFAIASAVDNKTVSGTQLVAAGGALYTIRDLGNGAGYTVQASSGAQQYLASDARGKLSLSSTAPSKGWTIFSVTYHD